MATRRSGRAAKPEPASILQDANTPQTQPSKQAGIPPVRRAKKASNTTEAKIVQDKMPKVLTIPELLDRIFKASDHSATLYACALTCRDWMELALDSLWANLDGVDPLLRLIAPMTIVGNQQRVSKWSYGGSPRIIQKTWERYRYYATRVRTIEYRDEFSMREYWGSCPNAVTVVCAKELNFVASKCPFEDGLVPNCRSIIWRPYYRYTVGGLVALLNPSLVKLTIWIKDESKIPTQDIQTLLTSIPTKAKGLKKLRLSTACSISAYQGALETCLRDLPSLEEVNLPPWSQSSVVIAAASKLPALSSLGSYWTLPYALFPTTPTGMAFHLPAGGFRLLANLEVGLDLTALRTVFEGPAELVHLKMLRVITRIYAPPAVIRAFVDVVPNTCPNLERLQLVLYSETVKRNEDCLVFDTLRPLLRCRSIKEVYMGHDTAMSIAREDVMDIGAAWPNLEILDLCKDPYPRNMWFDRKVLGTHFDVMEAVGQYLPNLRSLGLHFHEWTAPEYDGELLRDRPTTKTKLMVGTSDVPGDGSAVAFCLAAVLSEDVKIQSRQSGWRYQFWMDDLNPTNEDNDGGRSRRWEMVSGTIAMLHKTRRTLLESLRIGVQTRNAENTQAA